ncbi:MAG TPA: mevalonate kinase [Anaerolineales bacterium]|nr:mevalonate kinase [Anaerolineales bacterium]HNN13561.1 mevalonate kinase [Anaerolineales bacterium]HNO32064.1 mevalonate kinase [Anaerolineales bacterium]
MKSTAPGKIILFGEHAVVYNRPALAVPVNQVQAEVAVEESDQPGVWINAPDIDLHSDLSSLPHDHPIGSVILKVFRLFDIFHRPDMTVTVRSTIPVASGLGSGAAVSAALVRALAEFLGQPMTNEQVNAVVFEIEKIHHGTPSGIDNTVITYNMPVYYTREQPIETFKCGKPFTIVIGDTGISAPTKESVGDVRRLWLRNTSYIEEIFDEIAQIALIARRSIESGHPELLGELMEHNHQYLQQLSVSSPELDVLVAAAQRAGALGAKLSGGGRGGNMIALVDPASAESVAAALMSAGAKRTIITEIR